MKIRNRLALFFTFLAATLLLIFCGLYYYAIALNTSVTSNAATEPHHLGLLIGSGTAGLLLFYLMAHYYTAKELKAITLKLQEARKIASENLPQRLEAEGEADEVGDLSHTLNELLDRLRNSFELQRNFISNASHEIRNPLTAIMGEAEVCLEKRRSPEAYIDSLSNISREADRLDALINNLLSLAKTEIGETALEKEEIRLDEVLMEVKSGIDKINSQQRVRLDFSAVPSNPDWLYVVGNPNLLHVAFNNLMENALKFSKNKEVLIQLTATEEAVKVIVADQGIGIPREELQKIFQPFYRAKNARSFKGFGIGLSLTDKIVRMHKGSMQVHSEEGKGTTIEITFSKLN